MSTKGKQQSTARSSAPAKGAARGSTPQSTSTNRRRPSPAVYRRRRQVVFGALLLVIVLLVAGIVAVTGALSGKSEPQAVASPDTTQAPTQGTAPSGTPSPSASATPVCDFNLMTVAAKTDKSAYGAEEMPLLTMTITNGGAAPCEVNVGTSQMEYLVMSGADRIFSSKDCQTGGVDLIKTIQPGKSETANFPWQRNRTLEGCGAINAKPGAGGAYYTFEARLGNKASPKATFQLN
ncbi:hypothetical protein [Paenarthrobacter nitroguajacolicus]|uniref:hypothetical protein n=1 Tax=Paenarthrobacter nitroguajacolicus TaxID=211146 RepID=UPI00286264C3|nr:hypothetical protein [Paenarthrobacter nitroguajacolicus]MDR6640045.1 hypothetical protein [Paenarthrobacter nitroguajacolicus]